MPGSVDTLFRPFQLGSLTLPNRIVMAPMTRSKSPGGVPGRAVAAYYRRRAEGGVGLIVTEGTYIAHPSAGFDPNVPRFYADEALAGWKRVAQEVHAAGGRIFPQLWHVGISFGPNSVFQDGVVPLGPSGLKKPGEPAGRAMSQKDIDEVIAGYGVSARAAKETGFDGIEVHGAHGYLIDQFFWDGTNQRTDRYGGDLVARTRFAVEVLGEVRRAVGPDFPLVLRFSQWKLHDYDAKLARTPQDLDRFLAPLVDAGVDVFHCSTRRFWDPEFAGSSLNLAGWTKKLTGKPTITVGSVTLNEDFMTSFRTESTAGVTGLDELIERLDQGEFDLVALGRALIVNPDWVKQVRTGKAGSLQPFNRSALAELV
jgi:2,4-dienoyl-CoA reductase-like NADH-dependent reductase (Old Yellow Enzyme family)